MLRPQLNLARQLAEGREVDYWRALIRRALFEASTVDFYGVSEGGVDNLALVAAQAVVKELASP